LVFAILTICRPEKRQKLNETVELIIRFKLLGAQIFQKRPKVAMETFLSLINVFSVFPFSFDRKTNFSPFPLSSEIYFNLSQHQQQKKIIANSCKCQIGLNAMILFFPAFIRGEKREKRDKIGKKNRN
jgi:hypothetical protein